MNAPRDPGSGIVCTPTATGSLITMWGEVDTALRDHASDVMSQVLDRRGNIEIDTAQVSFIDSSGLAFILQLYLAGGQEQREVTLRDPSRSVEELLDMIGMTGRIPINRTPDPPRLVI